MKKLRILNLYAGVGGNRKLWGGNIKVTAVEFDPNIAAVYADLFPQDIVIVADAHEYLLQNFDKYDFIWASPPCPSHSRMRMGLKKVVYPDMKLYEEIILLQKWFKGKFVVENVIPYYKPLIEPTYTFDRHHFWCNYDVIEPKMVETDWRTGKVKDERILLQNKFGYNLDKYKGIDKRKVLRNAVVPELGLHFINELNK